MKYLLAVLFIIGLWYLALPAPTLTGHSTLPNSEKAAGATNTTYYTNNSRNIVTDFYRKELQKENCSTLKFINPFCYIKPFKINHSTNLSSTYFAPKQKSTYLEEYFYPLRNSITVNGYEPYDKKGKAFDKSSAPLIHNGEQFASLVTVRYDSSSLLNRLFIYILISLGIFWSIKLFKKIWKI